MGRACGLIPYDLTCIQDIPVTNLSDMYLHVRNAKINKDDSVSIPVRIVLI